MPYRVRLFIDFWNFQLSWNDRMTQQQSCDWRRLPVVFVAQAQASIASVGIADALSLEETRVYASYNPARSQDSGLRRWLNDFLDRQPSLRVFTVERADKPAKFYCRTCESEFTMCPACDTPLVRAREKGVDTAIVTDILSLAWKGAFDVAVLVTSDASMIPCVERVQEKGFKVINACWPGEGHELAQACWASFDIMQLAPGLVRT